MTDTPTPVLSIVTGTINRPTQLRRLVSSIVERTQVDWELLIMDASEASSAIVLTSIDPRIRYFHESPRQGHVKGYNNAFRMCKGEYVLWLNDDAEVLLGYDFVGIDLLERYPEVGMGAYYYKEGGRFHVNMLYQMIFANFGILPRWLGNKVGWFDDNLTMYGSDNSLTFRVLLAGYGVVTVPGANIIHHSENDVMRRENELLRRPDGDKLQLIYGPFKKQMQDVYARTKHLVGPRILA